MSSSSSAAAHRFVVVSRDGDGEPRTAGNPALTRARVLRGFSFDRGASPLDTELPGPPVEVTAQVVADERRGYDTGYEAGFAEGISAGRAAAAAETTAALARLEALRRSLAEAAEELRRHRALELVGLEDALARTAVDLASVIIGRELEVAASPGADAVARALGLVPAGCVAVARVHPADCDTVGELPGGVTVIADPAIEPGGCILEVGDSRIDAQLGPALDRVRAALLGER